MSSEFKIKKRHRISGVLLALMLSACLIFSVVLPASAETTSNAAVNDVASSVFQIRTLYTKDDGEVCYIQYGSSFLINENTVLTAAHVVNIDESDAETKNVLDFYDIKKIDEKKISYEVVVRDDVTVSCKIETQSEINDFAVVTLNKTINNRTMAILGDSDTLKKTQDVYSLGFPGLVTALSDRKTYTSDDVTITAGKIQNLIKHGTEEYIVNGSKLVPGNSGGPLVDEDGVVIGVNTKADSQDGIQGDYFRAVNINQVEAVLSDLGIEYTSASTQGGNDAKEETTDNETEETTVAQTEPPVTEPATEPEPAPVDSTKLIIIVAIIALVVILIVVVVIIIITSKKKSANKIQTPVRGNTVMPGSAPQPPQVPSGNRPAQPPYAQPYNRPSIPQQGAAPTMPSNDGAGETSVLNDGAGETTVLGNQSTGFFILRKRNNEKININKPEFVIGKERRRVDYCINDNNSISRAHAKIKVRAGRCYISDLGSTNFTYVNGSKLSPNQEVILSKGDKIKISDEEFEFLG